MVSDSPGQLRRILGVGFGLAIIIGGTIGVGILRTPGLVAAQLQSPSTIVIFWIVAGLYTLLCASCLTELGAMLPQAGGYYVYVRRAFGDVAGFAVGWGDWLTYCAVLGYVSIGVAEFLAVLVPSLSAAVTPIAIAFLLALVLLQWMGIRVSSRFQEVTTAVKCLAFLALIAACLLSRSSAASESSAASTLTLTGVVGALQAIVITYGGWQSALYFTEEDRDPARNLLRSMLGGIAAVIVIYLLVNVALLKVLPMSRLAGATLPAADAAELIAGSRGRDLITVLSIISLVPLLNAILMIGTRIIFALGRDTLFWSRTSTVNAGGTPTVGVLLTAAVAVALIATGTFQRLIAMTSFWLAANYCLCCLALFLLRRREPSLARPYRAWGYPWTAAIVVVGAIAFVIAMAAGDTFNAVMATALVIAGVVGRLVMVGVTSR